MADNHVVLGNGMRQFPEPAGPALISSPLTVDYRELHLTPADASPGGFFIKREWPHERKETLTQPA